MANFDDVFVKDDDEETIKLGEGEASGKLVLSTEVEDWGRRGEKISVSTVVLDSSDAEITLGVAEAGKLGKLQMRSIELDAAGPTISAGGNSGRGEGKLRLFNRLGKAMLDFDAREARLSLGGERTAGSIDVHNAAGERTAQLIGEHGNLILGGGPADGDLKLRSSDGQDAIVLDANSARITCGASERAGDLVLKNAAGETTVQLYGENGNLILGGNDTDGDITLRQRSGENSIMLDADNAAITCGGVGANGDVIVRNNLAQDTVKILGSSGDIHFLNADFAEEFTFADSGVEDAEPGTVVALDEVGELVPAVGAYNTKVVGVVAGAGAFQPALVLDKQGGANRKPVAMVGKVMCRVSTENGPIVVGDLLTTSDVPGCAMKVTDRSRALGAVIGKALAAVEEASGETIPVLVNLQ